ncbi:MAG: hypothetical protein P8R45_13160, partial [Candidatus Binatia bacterium]|nr:hypothetical protein [Candidatus Binatia bacterium]
MRWVLPTMVFAALLGAACGGSGTETGNVGDTPSGPTPDASPVPEPTPDPMPEPTPDLEAARLTHFLGELVLGPGEEIASQCV